MTASGKRNGHKHKQSRKAQVKSPQAPKRKTRAAPLNALHDDRKHDQQRTRESRHQRGDRNGGTHLPAGLDLVGLASRRTKAALELPTRMARCHSVFEVWGEQARFIQEGFADYRFFTQHMMANALRAFPQWRSESNNV